MLDRFFYFLMFMSFNLMCSKNKILINYKYIKFEYGGKGTREHLRVPTRMRRGGGGGEGGETRLEAEVEWRWGMGNPPQTCLLPCLPRINMLVTKNI